MFTSVTFDYTYIKENDNLVIDAIHSARTKFQVYFKEGSGDLNTATENFLFGISGGGAGTVIGNAVTSNAYNATLNPATGLGAPILGATDAVIIAALY